MMKWLRLKSSSHCAAVCRSKELTKRTIDHPNFRNVSINEAVKQLVELPSGEAIFRPHPKTTDLICLTIKVRCFIELWA